MKVKELIAYLEKCDPEEIVIGNLFTADDLADNEIGTPTQEQMGSIQARYWQDGTTKDTINWLSEIALEEMENN
jgi:hypothetical protein